MKKTQETTKNGEMTMKAIINTLALLAVTVLTGCASYPQQYVPQTVGMVRQGNARDGIQVKIAPQSDAVTKGDTIVFEVKIQNVGSESVWVPRDPDIVLIWTYPDGRRDNFVRAAMDEKFLTSADAVLLHPGEQVRRSVQVKTHYFRHAGITEFIALLCVPRNTNTRLGSAWEGRVASNAYGVDVLGGPGA